MGASFSVASDHFVTNDVVRRKMLPLSPTSTSPLYSKLSKRQNIVSTFIYDVAVVGIWVAKVYRDRNKATAALRLVAANLKKDQSESYYTTPNRVKWPLLSNGGNTAL